MIPEEIIAQVQRASDLVELVSARVQLKRSGRTFKGLCPFHQEKTPSFHVDPARQMFHCFGCGEGGTVFTWVMKQDGLTFPEAVRLLADRSGIRVADEARSGAPAQRVEAMLAANRWAIDEFRGHLKSPAGDEAKEYFKGRGFTGVSAARYLLGYAPQAGELLSSARRAGIEEEILEGAGLASRREDGGGLYERFRHRVMFPILDASDRPVGFGGRVLGSGEPKYLNTAQTPLFNKGRLLYGLSWAKRAIADARRVLVVEGYTDCLMAHQCGVEWTVATLGTALTEDHVRILSRHADTVVLLFDPDAAGQRAAARSLEVFARSSVDLRVAKLPGSEDPCEFLLREGREAFLSCLERAQGLVPFRLDWARGSGEWGSPEGRTRVLKELIGWAGASPDPIRREMVLKEICETSGLPEALVREEAQRAARPASAPALVRARRIPPAASEKLQRDLLRFLFEADRVGRVAAGVVPEDFAGGRFERLAVLCLESAQGGVLDPVALSARVDDEERGKALSDVLAVEVDGMDGEAVSRWVEQSLAAAARERSRRRLEGSRKRLRESMADPGDPMVDEELRKMQEELRKASN